MWIEVSKITDIPEGGSQLVSVQSKEVALFRLSGKIYAMENACAHRGGPLAKGYIEGTEVTCPWHAWAFDIKTGHCSLVPDTKQPTFKVKTENGNIFVKISL